MKILIDARLWGLENAGLGRYLMNLIKELGKIDKENEYTILLRKKYFDQLVPPPNWKKVLAEFRHYSLKEQLLLPLILYKKRPDVVHFPHFNVPLFYYGRFVVTIHDLLMHQFKGNGTTTLPKVFYLIKRFGYRIAFSKAAFGSTKILVPSNTVKNEIKHEYKVEGNKIVVTYEGVDYSVFSDQFDRRAKKILSKYGLKFGEYFIYSGNAYPHKNLPRAIEAFIQFSQSLNWKPLLVICSSRNMFTQRLKEHIKKIKAENYVKTLGFVEDSDYKVLLNHSIGFLYPSLSEGFGLQGLEAIASGTLLLASDIPVFQEVYGENVLYFDPNDTESMVSCLQKALKMSIVFKERAKFITEGQNFINRYSWSKMARETLEVYKQSKITD